MFDNPVAVIVAVSMVLIAASASAAEMYPLTPDHQRNADVPRGTVSHYTWTSHIFPGTVRDYWVYVPAQYDAQKPACVMVFNDGGGFVSEESRWRIPIIFDNLIAKHDMPVTVGIFINPGNLPPTGPGKQGRPNRSMEYDTVNGVYARFLIEEILPEVGKHVNLSTDPNDRAISGASSGGICAFTAAWFRPDAFRRVLSFVGSFANLKGGDAYPSMIRKTETKPIRAFCQSGKHDMNIFGGSWYVQNQAMEAAFVYMGYDYKMVIGEAGHDDQQGGSILPDALRWLWRDWPTPIAKPKPPADRTWPVDVVEPGKDWEVVPAGEMPAAKPAPKAGIVGETGSCLTPDGALLAAADGGRYVWSLQVQADGKLANPEPFYRLEIADDTSSTGAAAMVFDANAYLYVGTEIGIQLCDTEGRTALIIANPPGGRATAMAWGGADLQTLYVTAGGKVYKRHLLHKGA